MVKHYYFSKNQKHVSDDLSMLLEKENDFCGCVLNDVEPSHAIKLDK